MANAFVAPRLGWSSRAASVAALLVLPALAWAQEKAPYDSSAATMGASTFRTYCSSCHGKTAQGDGPLASSLRFAPPDLTRLARRSGGKYPFDKVVRIIDGRDSARGHGGGDMPVWGDAFLQSREGCDAEKVKEKINQLAHYLASVQGE